MQCDTEVFIQETKYMDLAQSRKIEVLLSCLCPSYETDQTWGRLTSSSRPKWQLLRVSAVFVWIHIWSNKFFLTTPV